MEIIFKIIKKPEKKIIPLLAICLILLTASSTRETTTGNLPTENMPTVYIEVSVPLPLNQDVLEMIVFFQIERRDSIIKALSLMDIYLPRIKEIFKEEGVPEVIAYLPLIESAYDPLAHSNRGAKGVWQFMPSTARTYGLRVDSWVDERINPEKSCRAAAKFLKYYRKKFGSWTLALAAYNGGPTRVRRAIRRLNTTDFWTIKQTRYIHPQTKRYIPAFIAGVYIAKNPLFFGFFYEKKKSALFDEVEIPEQTDLSVIAKCINSDVKILQKLNPELRRPITPYRYENYKLRIPKGRAGDFEANYAKIPADKRVIKRYHRVRRGDTLGEIARRYGTSIKSIMSVNNISSPRRLRIGRTIIIPMIPGKAGYQKASYSITKRHTKYKRGQQITYKVRSGDSLYEIASRYRTDIASICTWNGINREDILLPGIKLQIRYGARIARGGTPVHDGSYLTYVVRKGDTLYDIAKEHNVTIASLRRHNNIWGSRLYPGEKLIIPLSNN